MYKITVYAYSKNVNKNSYIIHFNKILVKSGKKVIAQKKSRTAWLLDICTAQTQLAAVEIQNKETVLQYNMTADADLVLAASMSSVLVSSWRRSFSMEGMSSSRIVVSGFRTFSSITTSNSTSSLESLSSVLPLNSSTCLHPATPNVCIVNKVYNNGDSERVQRNCGSTDIASEFCISPLFGQNELPVA